MYAACWSIHISHSPFLYIAISQRTWRRVRMASDIWLLKGGYHDVAPNAPSLRPMLRFLLFICLLIHSFIHSISCHHGLQQEVVKYCNSSLRFHLHDFGLLPLVAKFAEIFSCPYCETIYRLQLYYGCQLVQCFSNLSPRRLHLWPRKSLFKWRLLRCKWLLRMWKYLLWYRLRFEL